MLLLRLLGRGLWQIIRFLLNIIGWVIKEMFQQAKGNAKKVLKSLLWPIAGILAFLMLYALGGPRGFTGIILLIPTTGIMFLGLRIMLSGVFPISPKKKR